MNLLAEMSWEETKEYLARDDRIILPLGATEEHGRRQWTWRQHCRIVERDSSDRR